MSCCSAWLSITGNVVSPFILFGHGGLSNVLLSIFFRFYVIRFVRFTDDWRVWEGT